MSLSATKNDQGGIESMVSDSKATEKRMYTTGSDICPVKLLKHLIEKSDPSSTHLFNQYLRESVVKPEMKTWYSPKSLSKGTFAGFVFDICNAKAYWKWNPTSTPVFLDLVIES